MCKRVTTVDNDQRHVIFRICPPGVKKASCAVNKVSAFIIFLKEYDPLRFIFRRKLIDRQTGVRAGASAVLIKAFEDSQPG